MMRVTRKIFIALLLPVFFNNYLWAASKIIYIKGHKLDVEIALTEQEHQTGLMNRTHLKKNAGMLFIFSDEGQRSFWMKNTFIPLSLGFFDKNKKLLEMVDLNPASSLLQKEVPSYSSQSHAQYVLEVNQGWFKKYKIKIGEYFRF